MVKARCVSDGDPDKTNPYHVPAGPPRPSQPRSREACLKSTKLAIELAQRHGSSLHVLHISTADELALFDNTIPLEQKRITAEVCVHHMHFSADDYARLGNDIKCNPAIKSREHRDALLPALLDNRLDVIATDHAPHTRAEKDQPYLQAPSGLPLVQHSLAEIPKLVPDVEMRIVAIYRQDKALTEIEGALVGAQPFIAMRHVEAQVAKGEIRAVIELAPFHLFTQFVGGGQIACQQ